MIAVIQNDISRNIWIFNYSSTCVMYIIWALCIKENEQKLNENTCRKIKSGRKGLLFFFFFSTKGWKWKGKYMYWLENNLFL